MQQKRQQVLLAVLGVLVVVFLVWTFVFKSGDSGGSGAVEEPTVTTVVTAEVPAEDATPAVPGDTTTADTPAAEAPVPVPVDEPFVVNAYRNPFERQ
jgi:hypothetical protein